MPVVLNEVTLTCLACDLEACELERPDPRGYLNGSLNSIEGVCVTVEHSRTENPRVHRVAEELVQGSIANRWLHRFPVSVLLSGPK